MYDVSLHPFQRREGVSPIDFPLQLARLDRYESRLTSMAYMGNFDDLLTATQPVIAAKKNNVFPTKAIPGCEEISYLFASQSPAN